MKWTDHIHLTKVAAKNRGHRITSELIDGAVYPDKVGESGDYILGVNIGWPHHLRTRARIHKLIKNLRKWKLKSGRTDDMALGVLCHLIQDSEVVPFSHPDHEWMQEAIREETFIPRRSVLEQPLPDGNLLRKSSAAYLSSRRNNMEPVGALAEAFKKTDMVLGSLVRERDLPQEYREQYNEDKDQLGSIKRRLYWFLTYFSIFAPIFAYIDRKAIHQKDIVKRYAFVKEGLVAKTIFSFSGLVTTSVLTILYHNPLLFLLVLSFFLPLSGQFVAASMPISEKMRYQREWFVFPGERISRYTRKCYKQE